MRSVGPGDRGRAALSSVHFIFVFGQWKVLMRGHSGKPQRPPIHQAVWGTHET